ncbi:uncharacterized protein METZ01_LOCUS351559 [marine metagenome]|uniref:Uncharacterized protein n=1 Tax=marine metagenome TaxID=408172 RepID=A0A382RNH5_9ZZZZ
MQQPILSITKITCNSTNKETRLESINLRSGYKLDLITKIISRCGCFFHPDRPPRHLPGWDWESG